MISSRLSRRDLIRLGLVGAGSALLPSDRNWSPARSAFADSDPPTSPTTTLFCRPLPVPPLAAEVASFYDPPHGGAPDNPPPSEEHAPFLGATTQYNHVVAEERWHSFDARIPDTLIWGYRDATVPQWPYAVGPTLGGQFEFT